MTQQLINADLWYLVYHLSSCNFPLLTLINNTTRHSQKCPQPLNQATIELINQHQTFNQSSKTIVYHSPVYSFIHSFNQSVFIHSSVHLFIRSFIHSSTQSLTCNLKLKKIIKWSAVSPRLDIAIAAQ